MRVRKHVNPLNFRKDLPKLQINEIFANPALPLTLEIGSAHGEYLFQRAKNEGHRNFLGMEARYPLAAKIQAEAKRQSFQNLHFIGASSSVNLDVLPDNIFAEICIFFPDPWFKKRHHKRRIINPRFLKEIPAKLADTHQFYFQTDVETMFKDTLELLKNAPEWQILRTETGAQSTNPTGVRSWYEQRCIDRGWPIYRIEFKAQR